MALQLIAKVCVIAFERIQGKVGIAEKLLEAPSMLGLIGPSEHAAKVSK